MSSLLVRAIVPVLVSSAVVACGSDSPSGPAGPSLEDAPEWVYFARRTATAGGVAVSLHRIRTDGTGEERIAFGEPDGESMIGFDLSPDRSRFAVEVRDLGTTTGRTRIVLVDPAGGSRVDLDPPPGVRALSRPRWAPDGAVLLVLVVPETGAAWLGTITPDGGLTALTDPAQGAAREGSWSPAGDRIAFSWTTDPGELPHPAIRGAGGDITTLTGLESFDPPVWVPDGGRVLYSLFTDTTAAGDRTRQALHAVSVDGAEAMVLVPHDPNRGDPILPEYTPDGRHLSFVALNHQENEDVFLVDASGGNITTLVGGAGDQRDVRFSPDGAFAVYESNGDLWLTALDGELRIKLADDAAGPYVWTDAAG
jgi:Tol biopolymer transport system component